MANVPGGYQPDTKSPSARRADFDLRRRDARAATKTAGIADDVTVLRSDVDALQDDVLVIHDNLDAIEADVAALEAGVWFSLPLEAGWASYGSGWQAASYRKVGDIVTVRGLVAHAASLAVGTQNIVATVPGGFTPPGSVMFLQPVTVNTNFGSARTDVTNAGLTMYWAPGTGPVAFLSLDGISFSVTS